MLDMRPKKEFVAQAANRADAALAM